VSLSRVVEAPCANCNSLLDALVWQSINVSSDPFLKTLFWHEKINVAECENCHSICQLHLPFFYHDLDRDFLIVSMPEDMESESKQREILGIKARLSNFGDDAYRAGVHFVDGFTELRSKIVDLDGPPKSDLSLLSWINSQFQWFSGLVPPGWEPAAFAAPVLKSGSPILLKYELANFSDNPIAVCGKPRVDTGELPPSFAEIGIECSYEGQPLQSHAWLEYGLPGSEDVRQLAPGSCLSGEIDLAFLFPIREPGMYTVRTSYRIAEGQNDPGELGALSVRSITRHFVVGAGKPSGGFLSMFRRKKTGVHVRSGADLLAAWWESGLRTKEEPELEQEPLANILYKASLKQAEILRKQSGLTTRTEVTAMTLDALLAGDQAITELDDEQRTRLEMLRDSLKVAREQAAAEASPAVTAPHSNGAAIEAEAEPETVSDADEDTDTEPEPQTGNGSAEAEADDSTTEVEVVESGSDSEPEEPVTAEEAAEAASSAAEVEERSD